MSRFSMGDQDKLFPDDCVVIRCGYHKCGQRIAEVRPGRVELQIPPSSIPHPSVTKTGLISIDGREMTYGTYVDAKERWWVSRGDTTGDVSAFCVKHGWRTAARTEIDRAASRVAKTKKNTVIYA